MSSSDRRVYIDWARGLAVLFMIEAHTVDAWTRAASRGSVAFRNATILGGCAAPLFLWLAGLSVALAASRAAARSGSRTSGALAVCRRGVEILILAYLFRVQAFLLSPGSSPLMLFRVDILNIMGPAIAVAALLWAPRAGRHALVAVYAALAVAIALVTPIVRATPAVDALPLWLQWYVRPAGEFTNFTIFPWSGFVFAGAAVGVLIDGEAGRREDLVLTAIGVAGLLVAALGFYTATLPPIYAQSSFWTSSPTYFAVRAGAMMAGLALLFAIERRWPAARWSRPLATLGRHSLFVYWIHVELVYGYASYFWWKRLPLWGTAVGYAMFVALLYGAIGAKGRVEWWWRGRRGPAPSVVPA